MNETINLSFRYSERDFARAMRSHYASLMRPRFDIVVIILLSALGAWFWRSPGSHGFGVFLLGASAVLALILVAAFVIMPPLALRLQPKFRDDYSLAFSPQGIHFRAVKMDSQLQWSLYSRALVDPYSYIL
jgi:hypothetical protein